MKNKLKGKYLNNSCIFIWKIYIFKCMNSLIIHHRPFIFKPNTLNTRSSIDFVRNTSCFPSHSIRIPYSINFYQLVIPFVWQWKYGNNTPKTIQCALFKKSSIQTFSPRPFPPNFVPLHRIRSVSNKPHFIWLIPIKNPTKPERWNDGGNVRIQICTNWEKWKVSENMDIIWTVGKSQGRFAKVGRKRDDRTGKTLILSHITKKKKKSDGRSTGREIHKYSSLWSNVYTSGTGVDGERVWREEMVIDSWVANCSSPYLMC